MVSKSIKRPLSVPNLIKSLLILKIFLVFYEVAMFDRIIYFFSLTAMVLIIEFFLNENSGYLILNELTREKVINSQ